MAAVKKCNTIKGIVEAPKQCAGLRTYKEEKVAKVTEKQQKTIKY